MKKIVLVLLFLACAASKCMEDQDAAYIRYKTSLMHTAVQHTKTACSYLYHGTLLFSDVDQNNNTLLEVARQHGNDELVQILSYFIKSRETQETKEIKNRLLHESAQSVDRLRQCIDLKTLTFNSVDFKGNTLLHLAVEYKNVAIIEYVKSNTSTESFERIKLERNDFGMTVRDMIMMHKNNKK